MAISAITPAAGTGIEAGDSVSFLIDDTYTSLVIKVQTASALVVAYSTALGGGQSGYTVSVLDNGDGTHTVTYSSNAGWDTHPQLIYVVEDETGTEATTNISYDIVGENPYPQGSYPYNSISGPVVTSFNTRNGIVVPAAGDYDAFYYTEAESDALFAAYLPLAGGEMSGNITMAGAETVDGRDLSVDGTKLDLLTVTGAVDLDTNETIIAANTARAPLSGAGAPGVATGNGKNVGHIYVDTTSDFHYVLVDATTGANVWESAAGTEATLLLTGDASTQSDLNKGWDGTLLEPASVVITESGGTVSLELEGAGSTDLDVRLGGETFFYDTTPATTIALTAGTDAVPVLNYVWLIETAGTVSLATSTTGWPSTEYAAVATVLVQSAADVALSGPYKVHAWTDHAGGTYQGHLAHLSKWVRTQPATWLSGVAANSITVSAPNAYLSTDLGVIMQLHEHDYPAFSMSTGDPLYVVNEPGAAYNKITSLDSIDQDSAGGTVNNKWINLVIWGSVNEVSGDCKLFCNLPGGTYTSQANAEADGSAYSNYNIPAEYTGTGFLIANYVVKAFTSGTWVHGSITDLRGSFPSTAAGGGGGGGGVTDHGALTGLADDDHTQYHTDARGDVRYPRRLDGAGAPGVSTGDGYALGTVYADTTNDVAYTLVDATAGANVWSSGGGGGQTYAVKLTYDTSTTDGDPGGPGGIRFNNATPTSATEIYVDNQSADGLGIMEILGYLQSATNVIIWVDGDSTKHIRARVDRTENNSGTYATLYCSSIVASTSWATPANGTTLYMTYHSATVNADYVAMQEQSSYTGPSGLAAGEYSGIYFKDDNPSRVKYVDGDGTEFYMLPDDGKIAQDAAFFTERADHVNTFPNAGFAELWVKSDAPNVPMFTDDVGTDLRLGGAFTHSIAGGVVPANTTNWYGPNNYYTYYQGDNWTLAYGTGTDPAPAVYSMYPVAPRAGIIRDVQLWVRGSNTAIAGEVALYKFAQTNGSGTLTATKLNSAGISIPTITSTSQRYDASTTFTTANTVAAGDMISPFIKFSAGATNTLMFTLTYVMEYT